MDIEVGELDDHSSLQMSSYSPRHYFYCNVMTYVDTNTFLFPLLPLFVSAGNNLSKNLFNTNRISARASSQDSLPARHYMPTTHHAKSVARMDFVPNIVTPIQKSSISRIPPDILKSARNVIATEAKRLPGSEDHGLKAVKLGEGGYNKVFLISPVSLLQSCKSSLALTAQYLAD